MELTTEQLTKLEAWVRSQLGKTISATLVAVLTVLAVSLPRGLTTRLLLLTILGFVIFSLSLFLRVCLLRREINLLKDAPAKTPEVPLSECERTVLCMIVDSRGSIEAPQIVRRLKLDRDVVEMALEHLVDVDFVRQGFDSDYLPSGDFGATREGRLYVRAFRDGQ